MANAMTRTILQPLLLTLAAAVLLAGCIGWGHPHYGYGHHRDRWSERGAYDQPMGPRYAPPPRCTDDEGSPAPCPAER